MSDSRIGVDGATSAAGTFVYAFGAAELDERLRELRVGGHPVPVEAKPFDVLAQLLRRPGETLTKDELLDAVWPGRVVTEGVLAKCVMKLRALLGDTEQTVIRTVHGFGYRVGVPVERREAGEARAFAPRAGDVVPHRPHWRLVRALGEGGYALVWLVEHAKTREQRVYKYARDGASLAALKREVTIFRMLRETLGADAPIVRVLDWNVDEPPYHIEAEYLAGGNLAEWLSAHPDTPLARRLDLVTQCADAVAAAHRVGVLHKDLKPGNVLVRDTDAGPQAVLCDFGIGAVLEPERLAALGITRHGFTKTRDEDDTSGTPRYIAPEVLAGATPTTRSDVYALGVMLYQLVVGDLERPLGAGWERDVVDELLREDIAAAADVDPARRLADAAELSRRLTSLDTRRRERAAERAAVAEAARLRDAAERADARRRWQYALTAALVLGLVVSSGLAWRARLEAQRATREAEITHAVNAFLNEDVLGGANPYLTQRGDLSMREVLDRAAASVGDRFEGKPDVEAAVRRALGMSYQGIGAFGPAREHLERALALSRAESDDALQVRLDLAETAELDDRDDDATVLYRAALADAERRHGPDSLTALSTRGLLARVDYQRGEHEACATKLAALLPQLERYGPDELAAIHARWNLGRCLMELNRLDEATPHLAAARDAYLRTFGPDDNSTLGAIQDLALIERRRGNLDQAIALERDVLERRTRALGARHDEVLNAKNELASMLQDAKRWPEAEAMFRDVLAVREQSLGDRHERTRNSLNNLGLVLSLQGKLDEAEPLYRRALAVEQDLLGPDHLDVLILMHNLGGLERKRGRIDAALKLHRDVVERAERRLGAGRPEPALFRVGLAQDLQAGGDFEAARREFDRAREQMVAALGAEHPRIAKVDEMRAALAAAEREAR